MWAEAQDRLDTITYEAFNYLSKSDEVEFLNDQGYVAEEEPPDEPDALTWYYRVKRWGLPVAGGFMDQPAGFMEDIWAAERGVEQYQVVRATNERLRQMFAVGST